MSRSEIFSLKNDFAFKKFFTTSPELLVNFLNAILAETELDIAALDDKDRVVNIEMQRKSESGYAERVILYLIRLFAST